MEKYFDAKNTILYMGLYLLFYLFKNGVGIFLLSKSKNDTKVSSTPKPKNRLEQLENAFSSIFASLFFMFSSII